MVPKKPALYEITLSVLPADKMICKGSKKSKSLAKSSKHNKLSEKSIWQVTDLTTWTWTCKLLLV